MADALRPESQIDDIKEYHFHLYWVTQNKSARRNVEELLERIDVKNKQHIFVAKPLRINDGPIGPHPMSSIEIWVPLEYFGQFYGWISQIRPHNVSVMIHPLSKEQLLDHTDRIAFLGEMAPLYTESLSPAVLDKFPAQYPELGLGYSANRKEDEQEGRKGSAGGGKKYVSLNVGHMSNTSDFEHPLERRDGSAFVKGFWQTICMVGVLGILLVVQMYLRL